MGNLTSNFTLEEVTASDTAVRLGIDNTLPQSLLYAANHTAIMMELVRKELGCPIQVNSWYRCLILNRILKSKDTSQHMKAEAVDFIAQKFGSPRAICERIISAGVPFDQLILEYTWVHISFCANPASVPRGSVLTLNKDGTYSKGLI